MRSIIAISFIIFFFGSCKPSAPHEVIYLVPKNYQGVIVIVFNQKNGLPENSESGSTVYRIPPNGVLKTQGQAIKEWHRRSFFYLDSVGNKTEIPYYTAMDVRDKGADKLKIICYSRERGVTTNKKTNTELRFEVLLITSIQNLDSIAKYRDMSMDKILGIN